MQRICIGIILGMVMVACGTAGTNQSADANRTADTNESAETNRTAEAKQTADRPREPVVGLPCEGCEAVFEGLPDSLSWSAVIAPDGEPGERLRIDGTVVDGAGEPVAGAIVYAYHTDDRGIYPSDERFRGTAGGRHGRLRAWVRSNEDGRYRLDTIRPAGYPDTEIAAHVHMHIIEPGRCTYYIDDIEFLDDPRLSEAERQRPRPPRGGRGMVMPQRDSDGTWMVTRDIVLGENVPGYQPR